MAHNNDASAMSEDRAADEQLLSDSGSEESGDQESDEEVGSPVRLSRGALGARRAVRRRQATPTPRAAAPAAAAPLTAHAALALALLGAAVLWRRWAPGSPGFAA